MLTVQDTILESQGNPPVQTIFFICLQRKIVWILCTTWTPFMESLQNHKEIHWTHCLETWESSKDMPLSLVMLFSGLKSTMFSHPEQTDLKRSLLGLDK